MQKSVPLVLFEIFIAHYSVTARFSTQPFKYNQSEQAELYTFSYSRMASLQLCVIQIPKYGSSLDYQRKRKQTQEGHVVSTQGAMFGSDMLTTELACGCIPFKHRSSCSFHLCLP